MSDSSAVLMSIHPKYASSIKSGEKTVELRRVKPKLKQDDLVVIYETSPISSITAMFSVKKVEWLPLDELWKKVRGKACITKKEFNEYFSGNDYGCSIVIGHTWQMDKPISLDLLCTDTNTIRPPQSYIYLSADNIGKISQNMITSIL